jgi:hypothetical protein
MWVIIGLTLLVTGTVIWMLHSLGRIIMFQDKKEEEETDDYF